MTAYRVLYYGTPDFAVAPLRALAESAHYTVVAVVTQPDRAAGRGRKLLASPVKKFAKTHDIPILQPESVKKTGAAFLEELSHYAPIHIAVVCAFGQILPLEVLEFPNAASINIHASLLPRWRGAAPLHRAIMHGDHTTGVCLMKMEAGLDTGPVYCSKSLELTPRHTTGMLHDELSTIGGELLVTHLSDIIEGKLLPSPQPEEGVTYAKKSQTKNVTYRGNAALSRFQRIYVASRHILEPIPFLRRENENPFAAPRTMLHPDTHNASPGTVVRVDSHALEIACGSGCVTIEELQPAGKRPMRISEFLAGRNVTIGTLFTENQ